MSTRDQQVKAVVQGVALGALCHGVTAVTSSKMDLETAIRRSLGGWSQGRHFPSTLPFPLGANYVYLGLARSSGRQMVVAAWDTDGPWLVPYITMRTWTVAEALDLLASDSPVRPNDWIELAKAFVEALGEDNVARD